MNGSTLTPMFAPDSIAVIGASSDPEKMGSVLARSLKSFGGRRILVNERAPDPEHGLHESVVDGADGTPVDLAVLCVPASVCAGALERSADAGVRAALVCAGGFGETGEVGAKAEQELLEVSRARGIRLLGPNTSGFVAPHHDLRATFVPGASTIRPGRIGVVAASGGVNHALAYLLDAAGHGVTLAVGLGNGIDVDTADVVRHLADDQRTSAIAVHVESVTDGERLLAAIRRASAVKAVVALVVGRSDVQAFAQSHTGSLATSWRTTRSLLAQAGAVVVDDERELVDAVGMLSATRLPPLADPGVGLVTAQAGPGLLVLDDLRHHGVRVPTLHESTQREVARHLPPITFQANPVDTGRPAYSFGQVVTTVGKDAAVDLVAVYALAEPGAIDLPVVLTVASAVVPVVVGVGGSREEVGDLAHRLGEAGLAHAAQPSALSRGLRAIVGDARGRHRRHGPATIPPVPADAGALAGAPGPWTEASAKDLLELMDIASPRRAICHDVDSARLAFERLESPLVVKLLDAAVVHKTDVGGVHLGIGDLAQLDAALGALRLAGARAFLLEQMAPPGVDLLVGARRDPVFGPIVALGLGGVSAEVMADVSLRGAPVSIEEAMTMPDDLLSADLLNGWRGGPVVDRVELGRTISLLGSLLLDHPELDEVEINPLRVTEEGLLALDAVIVRSDHATTDQ